MHAPVALANYTSLALFVLSVWYYKPIVNVHLDGWYLNSTIIDNVCAVRSWFSGIVSQFARVE
jgi:hypothetical protein